MTLRAVAVAAVLGPAVTAVDAFRLDNERVGFTALVSALLVAVAIARLSAVSTGYRRSQVRERLLRESAVALVAARERKEIYAIAVDAAHALTIGDGRGRTAFGMGDLNEVEIVAARGDGADDIIGVHFPVGGLVDAGLHTRMGVQVDAFPSPLGPLVIFPLLVHGEPRGVISVRVEGGLEPPVLDAMRALGAQVALALENTARTEERLEREGQDRFRSLVQSSTDVIAILDRDRRVRYHTPSAEAALGYGTDELVGIPLEELVEPRDRGAFLTTFTSIIDARAEKHGRIDLRLRHQDGSWRDFEAVVTNLVRDPHIRGYVLTAHDVTERKALERRLAHQAFHDSLTGLANRALFLERVRHALERTTRSGGTVAALFVDLDDFKTVNDSLGHAAGDDLLIGVAERLREATRPTDTPARFGGDEFAVLLEDVGAAGDVAAVAERVLAEIARPIHLRGKRVAVRASIGIAIAARGISAEELLRNADTAMYTAKDVGKGRYSTFEPDMHVAAQLRLRTLLAGDTAAAA
jgi:diguanylate cyclase (GGDEF)-like protein/PAS domain S-box-containing protein